VVRLRVLEPQARGRLWQCDGDGGAELRRSRALGEEWCRVEPWKERMVGLRIRQRIQNMRYERGEITK
jgi:hypothetical protein